MAHHNAVFSQLLKFIPRHEFEALVSHHHQGRQLRKMSRWSQFVALGLGQLSCRSSLRDIVTNISAQASKLYHLGASKVSRSSLARANEQQPHTLYKALFGQLAPKHGIRFKNKLYSLGASTIDLCLDVFPWATFRSTKGAIKLHVGLDHSGYLPTFMAVTDGKVHDITVGRTLKLPKQSIVVFDRDYTDYKWYNLLDNNDIFFKWIKQNLKIKTFLGASKNAVLTQIWIAVCMYLLLAYIKFCNKLTLSLQQILRLLQLNLFEPRGLVDLLRGDLPESSDPQLQTQLQFT